MTRRWSRPRDDGGEPRLLADALARVGNELGLPDAQGFGRLVRSWPELVGANLALHAAPRVLRDGVLTVTVDAPAWATQVRYLGDSVLSRCAELLGPGVVTEIRVVVGVPEPGGRANRSPRR